MPLFMDTHQIDGLTVDAVTGAHQMDLDHQAEHGVIFKNCWYNLSTGTVHCLVAQQAAVVTFPSMAIRN